MSYGFSSPCWGCKKKDKGCTDAEVIQKSVNDLNNQSHKGSGGITLNCNKIVQAYPSEEDKALMKEE